MKAIVYHKYGSPDLLRVEEKEKPVPKNDQVLVRIHAASINSWDWDMVRGRPWVVRMWGLFRPKYKTPGCDMAGTIESVGASVMKFKPGDEVICDLCESGFGAFAEYKAVAEKNLTLKSAGMSFAAAATLPQSGLLALQSLRNKMEICPGQEILINGAAGAVGTIAIQLAKREGLKITGVDHGEKLDLLKELGCHHVIDYTKEDFTRTGKEYDLILDVITNRPLARYIKALKKGGTYVTVGGETGKFFGIVLWGKWFWWTKKRKLRLLPLKPNQGLEQLNRLFEEGKLVPVVDQVFPLERTADAFERFRSGKVRGKIVISMLPGAGNP